jgi:hypothetical protein
MEKNDTVRIFLTQFIPALYQHLESKGWDDIYMQHIADEPQDAEAPSYIRVSQLIKSLAPKAKVIDAVMSHQLATTRAVDVWVPLFDHLRNDYTFYHNQQEAGGELWYYTCCGPEGDWANRLMELPLIQTRMLHWVNYKYNVTGYLHWAFNYWGMDDDVYGEATPGRDPWPAGDSWISYPAYGKIYSSIRLEAMRDGIADYELLKLLDKKHPEKAQALADNVILDYDKYNNSLLEFRKTRKKLLQWLSE